MNNIDLAIIVILAWGAVRGWGTGFIKQFVSLLGFIVGLIIAIIFYSPVAKVLVSLLTISTSLASIIAFLFLWVIIPIVLGVIANLLTKTLKAVHLNMPNSVFGMFLGVFKYLLFLSCIFNVNKIVNLVEPSVTYKSYLYEPVEKSFAPIFQIVKLKSSEFFDDAKKTNNWLDTANKKIETFKEAVDEKM